MNALIDGKVSKSRTAERGSRLIYWMQRREEIWIRRAMEAASETLFTAMEKGSSLEQANAEAQKIFDVKLQAYGLEGDFEFEVSS
jgi:hypothetical protein